MSVSSEGKPGVIPGNLLDGVQIVTKGGNLVTKDGVSTQESDTSPSTNVFADPEIRDLYVKMYEKARYECRHVFDADLTWTAEEEKKLIRKVDWRNYNHENTIFAASFLVAELPSQLVSKKIGPDIWIPMEICLWSIVAMSQAAMTSRSGFFATRALLGILEGGFIPELILFLSYFYTSKELPIRLSFFWTALSVTGIISSLLAFGIFHLEGAHGVAGWKWLFLLGGLITLIYALGIIIYTPQNLPSLYLTLTLRSFGFCTFNANLLIIPHTVVHIFTLLTITCFSGKFNQRALVAIFQLIWTLPVLIFLAVWPGLISNQWGTYAATAVLLSYPYCHAIVGGWVSSNSNDVAARAPSQHCCTTCLSSSVGSVRPSCTPRMINRTTAGATRTLIATNVLGIGLFLFAKAYYVWKNKVRDKKWNAMTKEEQNDYIARF
ncbi:hypothetical protein GMDG_02710 [Pseudogymnoascus destructans 20631-21]|uniref:Major facilitator superfamily (MFS) profile domain-containing protein n=1 Tax=Pseudogymnoascus destructans (strain ATCC MYA-4855 / 20631-21) TaxID=658429 RepID=L8G4W0_PSED2|nr:hypothetical protein GMDG_02710 [Pseudogymnoascus destructans 20631-21]